MNYLTLGRAATNHPAVFGDVSTMPTIKSSTVVKIVDDRTEKYGLYRIVDECNDINDLVSVMFFDKMVTVSINMT